MKVRVLTYHEQGVALTKPCQGTNIGSKNVTRAHVHSKIPNTVQHSCMSASTHVSYLFFIKRNIKVIQ